MYRATVFIIGKRRELLVKYKKIIEALNQEVYIFDNLSEMFQSLPQKEPELIIVSDTIKENLEDFSSRLRVLTFNFRPTIIAVSKSSDIEDRLKVLESGADDFLSEQIQTSEFQARIKAHLRRSFENSINPLTFFVKENITLKVLKRSIQNEKTAVMLIKIMGLNIYREIYGEIAYEKILQTLGAIINSSLDGNDFIGQFRDNEFILITNSQKTEHIASFLTYAFDNVLKRFYNEGDYNRGFIISKSDDKTEDKIPLMKLIISATETEPEVNYKEVLNLLNSLLEAPKKENKSSYIINRIRLQGESHKEDNKKILVFESDFALSSLIEANCELKGYKIKLEENKNELLKDYEDLKPEILIIDYGREDKKEGLEICRIIKQNKETKTKIIFSSSIHNKEEILSSGADLYLPKPYDINELLDWIGKYLG